MWQTRVYFNVRSRKVFTHYDIENKQLKQGNKKLNVNENENENETEKFFKNKIVKELTLKN